MSNTDKFKPAERLAELHRLEEARRLGAGKIEFDELDNAVWVPIGAGSADAEAMRRLLDDDTLAIGEDDARGTSRRIQPNPGGLKKGYDPYDSGMLVKKQWKKKRDLRALSDWIEGRKKLDAGR